MQDIYIQQYKSANTTAAKTHILKNAVSSGFDPLEILQRSKDVPVLQDTGTKVTAKISLSKIFNFIKKCLHLKK